MSAQETGQTSNYQVGAPPVAVPTPKSQEMVLVRRSELQAITRTVERAFSNPVASASGWSIAWLGVAIGAGISLLAVAAPKGQHIHTWVLEAHIAVIVVGAFLAAWCWWFDRKNKQGQRSAKDDCTEQLKDLDERAPTTVSDQP
jgi:hypothetical protein